MLRLWHQVELLEECGGGNDAVQVFPRYAQSLASLRAHRNQHRIVLLLQLVSVTSRPMAVLS